MSWVETIINGIFLGGLYALFGLGLAFAFGVLRIVNVAQGEFIVLAAYIGLVIAPFVPFHPLLLLIPVAFILFVVGLTFQVGLINRVIGKDPLPPLLLTFGVSIILRNLFLEVWGADDRSINVGTFKYQSVVAFGIHLGILPLTILGVSLALFAALQRMLHHTAFGRTIRATADDHQTVQLFGINYRSVYAVAMGIALALSSVAGVFLAMRSSFNAFSGVDQLLISFEVVIIGGVGSLWGMLAGGFILGVTQLVGLRVNTNSGLLYAHLVFFLILMVLPSGLSSWRRR
jgi:branched-chain amino acid transport system permease protein